MIRYTALTLLVWLVSNTSLAADKTPLTYDRISLSASSGQEVENDTLVAVMHVQLEGNDAEKLARIVNKQISAAVAKAKANPAVKVQTLEYSTQPIYRKQSHSGWRVRQSIRLESGEATVLSQLIGELQQQLGLSSIHYTISPELRSQVENRLIKQAITAFNARAAMVSEAMQRDGYRLVEMNINTSGNGPEPVPMPVRAMAMEGKGKAPRLEAGSRRIQVHIGGSIELNP